MYSSWSPDLNEYRAHQRKIVRHFAPHLSNLELKRQEQNYFIIGITRIVAVFVIPSLVAILVHRWFIKTPVFMLVALVSLFELVMAFYRYFVLWPEGHQMRWNYWRQIETSEDCYKLKIMGYYHRKITKFTGRFPPSMASSLIRSHYRKRSAFMVVLFLIAYVVSLGLLLRAHDDEPIWLWILYLLATGSAMVIFRFIKMHFIELPQVLSLRDHPEFSIAMVPETETIPFARPVTTYQAMEDQPQPIAQVTSLSPGKSVL